MAEDEWEEQIVFVELVGLVDPETLELCTSENTAILGIDTEMPVLNLGGYAFGGPYKESVGTLVMFEEVEDETGLKSLEYLEHTTKILEASRMFLKPKKPDARLEAGNDTDHIEPSNENTKDSKT